MKYYLKIYNSLRLLVFLIVVAYNLFVGVSMQKAVIYVRVSTDEQAKHGYSIDMQQNQCLNFAERNGYQVTNIYIDDGYTAKNMNVQN